jgi:uncharacterized membrane protein
MFTIFVLSIAEIAIVPRRDSKEHPVIMGFLSYIWIPGSILVLAYTLFHLFVVVPLSYFSMLIATALVLSIPTSADDKRIGWGTAFTTVNEIISCDILAAKCFTLGIPAMAFALGIKAVYLFV